MRRAALIVLDGVGCGRAHDQEAYGDQGSDSLGNVLARAAAGAAPAGYALPNLSRLGLGRVVPLPLVPPVAQPLAAWGTAQPASPGKDSTTGHWEICGLILDRPFPVFPGGFPSDLLEAFARETGRPVIGNRVASGTAIIDELGAEHQRTGAWIVYTSADSVFQVAAHEDTVPVEELYRACEVARRLCTGPFGVSRVIARPFEGAPGGYRRTPRRRDFSLSPVGPTLLDHLEDSGVPRIGVGKVDDLFAGRGIFSTHPASNAEAYRAIAQALEDLPRGLVFANVIDFDQTWGHRNDVAGYLGGLAELDAALPGLLERAQPDDLVIFTADHGNDPTTPSTDHSRERVPVLAYGAKVRPLGIGERATFADVGQTVAEFLGVGPLASGRSFLREIWNG